MYAYVRAIDNPNGRCDQLPSRPDFTDSTCAACRDGVVIDGVCNRPTDDATVSYLSYPRTAVAILIVHRVCVSCAGRSGGGNSRRESAGRCPQDRPELAGPLPARAHRGIHEQHAAAARGRLRRRLRALRHGLERKGTMAFFLVLTTSPGASSVILISSNLDEFAVCAILLSNL